MAALASITDVEDGLGRSLTSEEQARAVVLLDRASAVFRKRARQPFQAGTSTVRLRSRAGTVRLPYAPVTDVTAVTEDDGTAVTDWEWEAGQVVTCLPCGWLHVTFDHGHDTIPADVVGAVSGMVERALSASPAANAGATMETTGPFQVQYAAWAIGGQVLLSPADKAVADSYRLPRQALILP